MFGVRIRFRLIVPIPEVKIPHIGLNENILSQSFEFLRDLAHTTIRTTVFKASVNGMIIQESEQPTSVNARN